MDKTTDIQKIEYAPAPEKGHAHMMYFGALIGVLGGTLPLLLAVGRVFPSVLSDTILLLLASTLITAFILMAPGMVWARNFPHVREAIGLRRLPRFSHYVALTILGLCAVLLADILTWAWSGLLGGAGSALPTPDILPSARNGYDFALLLFIIAVLPAISEEYLFRGILLSAYRPMGEGAAIFLSGVLFAAMHGILVALPAHLLLGLLLGYCVMKTGSLHAGIYLHFLYNGIVVSQDFFSRFHFTGPIAKLYFASDWTRLWPLALAQFPEILGRKR